MWLAIVPQEKRSTDEETYPDASHEEDGMAIGGLDRGWRRSGAVKALCTALGSCGAGDEAESNK